MWIVNVFVVYEIVYGWSTHGKLESSFCIENSKVFMLTNCDKTSFFIATRDSC
jgi:hypothetical protein